MIFICFLLDSAAGLCRSRVTWRRQRRATRLHLSPCGSVYVGALIRADQKSVNYRFIF